MSITVETAKAHEKDPAVLCCRFEAGTVIEPSNLEDPAIFPDLVDSGLLEIGEDTLTIGEVLGAKLVKTSDALTPLTRELLDGVKAAAAEEKEAAVESVEASVEAAAPVAAPAAFAPAGAAGNVRINIGEGKNISLEIPLTVAAQMGVVAPAAVAAAAPAGAVAAVAGEAAKPAEAKEVVIRSLKRKHFKIDKVEFGDETKIEGTTLYLRKGIDEESAGLQELVVSVKVEIVTPEDYGKYSETIMDVQPIATKEEGDLGTGVTRVLDGVVMMVTGTDEGGVQIGEFGSSEGILKEQLKLNKAGTPSDRDYIIHIDVLIKGGEVYDRRLPNAAFKACDIIISKIREILKKQEAKNADEVHEFYDIIRPNAKRVALVKQVAGQGAMYDNLLFPHEPSGFAGGISIIDLGNMPVVLSPNEYRDGVLRALV